MPRNYVKKRQGPYYSVQDLAAAVHDVQNHNCTYRQAFERYGVPITVIYNRINGRKCPIDKIGAGRATVLTKETEEQIALCLKARSKIGLPCDKEELKDLVAEYIKSNRIETPFKDGRPGEDWYLAFMKRQPTLSLKKPEHLQKARKSARDPFIVYDFYDKMRAMFMENDLMDETKAAFVFNCDETGFCSDPSRLRGIGEKGKPLNRISGGSGRENTTVLLCISANGNFLPPLIIFKGLTGVQPRWISEKCYPGTQYATSKNGWMEEAQFFNWFEDVFILYVKELRTNQNLPNQTACLIYDGHSSHCSLRIIEKAISNNIQLIRLPSHLTDRIQPLDKCVFGPVKVKWDKLLVQFGKTQMGLGSCRLTREKFGEILGVTLTEAITSKNVVSGFKSTGLFPIDETKFSEDLFDPIDLQRYKNYKKKKMILSSPPTSSSSTSEFTINQNEPSTSKVQTTINVVTNNIETSLATPTKSIITSRNELEVTPELNEIALDLTTRIHKPSPEKIQHATRSMVEIFSNVLKKDIKSKADQPLMNKVPRLKCSTYGEVLTNKEVMERMKEAQENKKKKNMSKAKNSKQVLLQGKKQKYKKKEELVKSKLPTKRIIKRKKLEESESEEEIPVNELCNDDELDDVDPNDVQDRCLICDDFSKKDEYWFQCSMCGRWAHELCSGVDSPVGYICDFCG